MGRTVESLTSIIDQSDLRYLRCSEADEALVHQAFQDGFSDYMLKMEVSKDDFIKRFFGPEGNTMEHSFIAFYKQKPVGVILGGIKNYESIRTMRCGALAISPNFRGLGISQMLFKLHKEEAIKQGCKQLLLEVIVGNDRAINFYTKLGYEKVYDIVYYSNIELSQLIEKKIWSDVLMKKISFNECLSFLQKWNYHINWQNDVDYLAKAENIHYYAAYFKDALAGCISISANGNISFLMVDKKYRGKGIGSLLLQTVYRELNVLRMSSGFPNNSLLEGFFKKNGFKKNQLSQYEMYLLLE
ncbi:MAG: GNAT family N-acetyltransferase [Bacillota bacterium]|nr:GNAT family N-acetyltransferase [Bacillota bacterium]